MDSELKSLMVEMCRTMKVASQYHDKADEAFRVVSEVSNYIYEYADIIDANVFFIVNNIVNNVGRLAIQTYDYEFTFDGREFCCNTWNYNTIQKYIDNTLTKKELSALIKGIESDIAHCQRAQAALLRISGGLTE